MENKEPKVVGCMVCGFRTDNPEEIQRFKKLDFFCCNSREELVKLMRW